MISILIAFILSVILPGSGQIFNGQFVLGAAAALFFVFARPAILPLAIRIINFKTEVKLLKFIYFFNIFYSVFIILTALDACFIAAKVQNNSLLQALYCLIFALILSGAARALKSSFIVSALSGRQDIYKYIFAKKQ